MPKDTELSANTLRDLLKLHGAGALVVGALASTIEKFPIIFLTGGVMFALGIIDSLWNLRKLILNKGVTESRNGWRTNIDFSLVWFVGGLLCCTIGIIATYFRTAG